MSASPILDLLEELSRRKGRPFVTSEAARYALIPGKTDQGRAQKLRRLEAAKVVPAARRSLARGDRFYEPVDVVDLRQRVGR